MPLATIRQVAKKSGVSTATVSRVLGEGEARKRCSADVIQRVEAAANELGYRVNYHLRSVSRNRSDTIGYITEKQRQADGSAAGTWYLEQIAEGLQAVAQDAGCAILQVRSGMQDHGPRSALRRGIHFLQERRIDGFVLPGSLSSFHGRLDDPANDKLPVVVVEPAEPTRWCTVGYDEALGIRLILSHLMELGHRELLWLGPEQSWRDQSRPREELFLRAAFAAGARGHSCFYDDPLGLHVEDYTQRVENSLLHHLENCPKPFTAIVAYNDLVALAACRALARKGLRVPVDVSVTGFDDECSMLAFPPVTTVTHELFEMGVRAGQLILEIVDADADRREELRTHRETFTPRLIVRESTGPAPH